MSQSPIAYPPVTTHEEWLAACERLQKREKESTRALDALAAERRRLPMVAIEAPYRFDGPDGSVSLLDLFQGRRQLILYHFMFGPGWEEGCIGCSMLADSFGHLVHLHARDTSLAVVSRAPLDEILPFKARMGWTFPWLSSFGSDFNFDLGASVDGGEISLLSVFLRDGDRVYLTYQTTARGLDRLNTHFNLLDLTPFGRQEDWEDSPDGWPRTPPYVWWRYHDRYDDAVDPPAPAL